MPLIKFKHVVSCSSEDKAFPADNLLESQPHSLKKWKCANAGENQAVVILQFEKASQIHSIHIGNEGSAWIEIFVGRSSDSCDQFHPLMPAAQGFMSPQDARNQKNMNQVRIFGTEKLEKSIADEKWDRMKIVCAQPFDNKFKYGLAFICPYSPEEKKEQPTLISAPASAPDWSLKTIGAFKLKSIDEEEKEEKMIAPGSMFAHRNQFVDKNDENEAKSVVGLSSWKTVSDLGSASGSPRLLPALKKTASSPAKIQKPSNFSSASAKETKAKEEKIAESKKRDHQEAKNQKTTFEKKTENIEKKTAKPEKQKTFDSSSNSSPSTSAKPIAKPITKQTSSPSTSTSTKPIAKREKKVRQVDFSDLMGDVLFVLSGFENPFRTDLREKAQAMGAQYRSDWGKGCTHLVCAFTNTPKFNQVKGKGKIVSKNWIIDSFNQKRRLPWRKYSLEKVNDDDDSEMEELVAKKEDSTATSKKRANKNRLGDDEDSESSGGGNTDDEIERVMRKAKRKKESMQAQTNSNKDKKETVPVSPKKAPIETIDLDDDGMPMLPNYFEGMKFFLFGSFTPVERKQINRFATAFNGQIDQYWSDAVTHVVTKMPWCDEFDDALVTNKNLKFVHPDFILKCGESGILQDIQQYLVMKK